MFLSDSVDELEVDHLPNSPACRYRCPLPVREPTAPLRRVSPMHNKAALLSSPLNSGPSLESACEGYWTAGPRLSSHQPRPAGHSAHTTVLSYVSAPALPCLAAALSRGQAETRVSAGGTPDRPSAPVFEGGCACNAGRTRPLSDPWCVERHAPHGIVRRRVWRAAMGLVVARVGAPPSLPETIRPGFHRATQTQMPLVPRQLVPHRARDSLRGMSVRNTVQRVPVRPPHVLLPAILRAVSKHISPNPAGCLHRGDFQPWPVTRHAATARAAPQAVPRAHTSIQPSAQRTAPRRWPMRLWRCNC